MLAVALTRKCFIVCKFKCLIQWMHAQLGEDVGK